jgi:hypothetical protein
MRWRWEWETGAGSEIKAEVVSGETEKTSATPPAAVSRIETASQGAREAVQSSGQLTVPTTSRFYRARPLIAAITRPYS